METSRSCYAQVISIAKNHIYNSYICNEIKSEEKNPNYFKIINILEPNLDHLVYI